MARSWEYSRARRVAMQVTMWLIFAATLALAGFVAHEKQVSQRVELENQPRRFGNLLLHVPQDWAIEPASTIEGKRGLVLIEPRRGRGPRRILEVWQEPLNERSSDAGSYLAAQINDRPFDAEPFHFKYLGDGVYAEAPAEIAADGSGRRLLPSIYACVLVPASARNSHPFAVLIELAVPSFGSSDRKFVQQLADGIAIIPPGESARASELARDNPALLIAMLKTR